MRTRLSKEQLEAEARKPRNARSFGWQSPALEARLTEVDRLRRLGRKQPAPEKVALDARLREHERFLARIDAELGDIERRIDALT